LKKIQKVCQKVDKNTKWTVPANKKAGKRHLPLFLSEGKKHHLAGTAAILWTIDHYRALLSTSLGTIGNLHHTWLKQVSAQFRV
jgi:hypothetical protein